MRPFEPSAVLMSSFLRPMAARADSARLCRGVDFEQAVLGGLAQKTANSRVGLGRQKSWGGL